MESNQLFTTNECCTEVTIHEFEYKWEITNFNSHLQKAAVDETFYNVTSSNFTTDNYKNTKWCLQLQLKGGEDEDDYDDKFSGIFLRLVEAPSDKSEIFLSQIYFLIDAEDKKIMKSHLSLSKFTAALDCWGTSLFYEKETLLKEADKYLSDDTLTIVCCIGIMGETMTSPVINCHPRIPNINNNFADMLTNEKFCDVTFVINNDNDRKIKAHKIILAGCSTVFAAMFQQPIHEKDDNVVKINDIDARVFNKMLKYIYTSEIDDYDDIVVDLMATANKYRVDNLKMMCRESLCNRITVDNAAETLIIARQCNDEKFIEYVKNFISNHRADVMMTSGYEIMVKDHPELGLKFYRTVTIKKAHKKTR